MSQPPATPPTPPPPGPSPPPPPGPSSGRTQRTPRTSLAWWTVASVGLNVVLLVAIALMTQLPSKAATAARTSSTPAPTAAPTAAPAAPGTSTPTAAPVPLTGLFTFTSETGDYIGQGLTKQFGPPHDTLTVSPEGGGDSASATTSGFTVHVSAADAEYWDITVAPPHGQTLHEGNLQCRHAGAISGR